MHFKGSEVTLALSRRRTEIEAQTPLFNFLEDKAVLLSISSEYIKLSAQ
jgi:hypothetical protein